MPSTTTPLLLDTAPPARRPHLQAALLAAALLLAGAALGTALAGAWGWNLATAAPPAASAPSTPPPPLAPDCFFALGGGTIRSGGVLPDAHTRSAACAPALAAYLASGAYDADVVAATASAAAYLASVPRPSPAALVVMDVDETALSNRAEWVGWEGGEGVAGAPPANLRARLDGAALDGSAPALAPTLRLYRAALAAGFSVAFVTGRSGRPEVRNATVANLEDAGYGRACGEQTGAVFALAPRASRDAPPCYSALLMRPPNDGRPASVVKPTLRAALLAAATEADPAAALVASVGDQFSDLGGDPSPHAAFKLPNPVYFFV